MLKDYLPLLGSQSRSNDKEVIKSVHWKQIFPLLSLRARDPVSMQRWLV